MGKKILIAFLALFLGYAGFCNSVSFQVVQHNNSLSDVCNSSLIIEDEIMNNFYNAGFIVSNWPASISNSNEENKKLWNMGYTEAVEGSFDYFIQINLFFNESESTNVEKVELGLIDKVSWKIVSSSNGNIIEEKNKNIEKPMGADSEDNVRLFAKDFSIYLQKVLKIR